MASEIIASDNVYKVALGETPTFQDFWREMLETENPDELHSCQYDQWAKAALPRSAKRDYLVGLCAGLMVGSALCAHNANPAQILMEYHLQHDIKCLFDEAVKRLDGIDESFEFPNEMEVVEFNEQSE